MFLNLGYELDAARESLASKLKVGDRVVLAENYQSIPAGAAGQIIKDASNRRDGVSVMWDIGQNTTWLDSSHLKLLLPFCAEPSNIGDGTK